MLDLVKDITIHGLSLPWNLSAVSSSTSLDNISLSVSSWPLYGVNTPISFSGMPAQSVERSCYVNEKSETTDSKVKLKISLDHIENVGKVSNFMVRILAFDSKSI